MSKSNPSGDSGAPGKDERVGPDYFGYYNAEVANLLSQNQDDLPADAPASEIPQNQCGERGKNNLINRNDNCSCPLYSNGVGAGLSDLKRDRLRSLLRQSVTALSSEVHEVVDPVFAICQVQSKLRSKTHSLDHTAIASDDVQVPRKKLKVTSPSSSASLHEQISDANPSCSKEVNDDLQFLLENDSVEIREMVKKYSKEVSGTLENMEKQLETLLDTVMTKCRPMTLGEKQQLQRSIKKLPAGNLYRVAELICRNRPPEEPSSDEIFVDLEKEDNVTLWRLYYYVEAVEKAKRLSCNQEV